MDTLVKRSSWGKNLLTFLLILAVAGGYLGLIAYLLPFQSGLEGRTLLILQAFNLTHHLAIPMINGAIELSIPPLYYWLAWAWSHVFGLSVLSLRMLNCLLAAINLGAFYLITQYLWDRRFARLAVVILGSALIFLLSTANIGPYLLSGLCFNLLLLSLLNLLSYQTTSPSIGLKTSFWLALAACVLSTGLTSLVFTLGVLICYSLIMGNTLIYKNIHTIRGYILFLAISLPWFIYIVLHCEGFIPYFFYELPVSHLFLFTPRAMHIALHLIGMAALAFAPWIIFLPTALKFNWPQSWARRDKEIPGVLLLVWSSLLLLGMIIFTAYPMWLILLMPAFSLMTARYIAAAWDIPKLPYAKFIYEIIFLGLILLAAYLYIHGLMKLHISDLKLPSIVQIWLALILFACILIIPVLRYARFKTAFIALTSMTLLIYLAIAGFVHTHTLPQEKMIADYIQTHASKEDVVANYRIIYPLVNLAHPYTLVIDWKNPPVYAQKYQESNPLSINASSFWDTLAQTKRHAFIVMTTADYQSIKQAHPSFKPALSAGNLVVITNS